ncbi:MAG: hypothetical protein O3B73_07150 [bacterium]|nr:hypothetical protein [bacterium]
MGVLSCLRTTGTLGKSARLSGADKKQMTSTPVSLRSIKTWAFYMFCTNKGLKAIDALTRATDRDPTHAPSWEFLAYAHSQLGHVEAARTAYLKAKGLAITP